MKFVFVLLATLVVGCASITPPDFLPTKMHGKSKADVLECLGPPTKSAAMDGLTFWTYRYEDTDRNATWNCELRLKINGDKVEKVDSHSTVENIFGTSKALCTSAVAKC